MKTGAVHDIEYVNMPYAPMSHQKTILIGYSKSDSHVVEFLPCLSKDTVYRLKFAGTYNAKYHSDILCKYTHIAIKDLGGFNEVTPLEACAILNP